MISLSRLLCDRPEVGDRVRYAQDDGQARCRVVVWNVTRRCDLRCRHCYAATDGTAAADELTPAEGRALIKDLAGHGVQVLLLSGGEPLQHPRILELIGQAAAAGLRPVLSTNGLALDPDLAARLAGLGLGYVGISLDGGRDFHDAFRGRPGAFDRALAAIRICRAAGLKVGLRFTVTRANQDELPRVFAVLEAEEVARICVYHLAYAGRGLAGSDQDHASRRTTLDWLIDQTRALHAAGRPVEVLTVDNHCDGPYLVHRLLAAGRLDEARRVHGLLRRGGGNSSGERLGCVSWDGTVHPDQFWRQAILGSVRQRPFSAIWSDPDLPLLARLRRRRRHIGGRCARCFWFDCCRGNLRVRAEAATGEAWGEDPACYLSEAELGQPDSLG